MMFMLSFLLLDGWMGVPYFLVLLYYSCGNRHMLDHISDSGVQVIRVS